MNNDTNETPVTLKGIDQKIDKMFEQFDGKLGLLDKKIDDRFDILDKKIDNLDKKFDRRFTDLTGRINKAFTHITLDIQELARNKAHEID